MKSYLTALLLLGQIVLVRAEPPLREHSLPDALQQSVDQIVADIEAPSIPDRVIDLATFSGKKPDAAGTHDFRQAIQDAIDALDAQGGGTLLFSHTWDLKDWRKYPEVYRVRGPILLKSHIELLVEPSIIVQFDFDPISYLPDSNGVVRRYEGSMAVSFSGLIRAFDATDLAIRARPGSGAPPEIRGSGFEWKKWSWDGQQRHKAEGKRQFYDRIRDENHADTPVSQRVFIDPENDFFRPVMLEFYFCKRVVVEGIRLTDAPFWTVHPVFSSDLVFRNLQFDCYGANSDGIDPDSSRNILIENIIFGNDDDNVAIKSGRDRDGRAGADIRDTTIETIDSPYIVDGRVFGPTENVVVRNCVFQGHHAIAIGSEMSGDVRNVYVVHNRSVQSVNMGFFVKGSRRRGGTVENVHLYDLQLNQVRKDAIALIPNYDGDTTSPYPPHFAGIHVRKLRVAHAQSGIRLHGWPDAPIRNVSIEDVVIDQIDQTDFELSNGLHIELNKVSIAGRSLDGDYADQNAEALAPAQK